RDLRRPWAELRPQLIGAPAPDSAAKYLRPWPVRWGAASLPAATPEHLGAACGGAACDLRGKPALADARLAPYQLQPACFCQRVVERTPQPVKFVFSTDEDAVLSDRDFNRIDFRALGAPFDANRGTEIE